MNAHTYILHYSTVLQKNVFFWMWTGSKFETFCTSHCPLVNYEKYLYRLNDVPIWFKWCPNKKKANTYSNHLCFYIQYSSFSKLNFHGWWNKWSAICLRRDELAQKSFPCWIFLLPFLLDIPSTFPCWIQFSILLFLYQTWLKITKEFKNKITVPTCKSLFHRKHKLKKRKHAAK